MNGFDRRRHRPRASGRRGALLAALVLTGAVAVSAALAAGCGGSGGTPAVGQGAGATSIQVLTQVQRGDLVETAMGSVKIVTVGGKTVPVATVPQQAAGAVNVGQKATVMFFRAGADGQSGFPAPSAGNEGPSGLPSPPAGADGQNAPGGLPSPPAGANGQGAPFGQAGSGQGRFGARGTPGTVTAVKTNADGSAAVTIAVNKLPADVAAKSVGFASIQTKVLAANVVIIPTAAITGSGDAATVQVLAGGKTSTRTVVVGQQAGTESEIVSGLSVGENVVWERSFQGGGAFPGDNGPTPGQSAPAFDGGQAGGSSQ
jgi:hypothetical protein